MRPQNFDILGTISFSFIIALSIYALTHDHGALPEWSLYVLLAVGIFGFLIDTTIVYLYFGTKKK